jgi:hypothetical protein
MAGHEGAAARRSREDKEKAAVLKRNNVERRDGRCCICYGVIGNDTFGGTAVLNHYSQHARGWQDRKRK